MDVLLLAEYYALDIHLPRITIQLVPKRSGYAEFAWQILQGAVQLRGIKVIVLLIGRADVLNRAVMVGPQIEVVRAALNKVDPAIILLVGTPLPWPLDPPPEVAWKLFRMSAMIKVFCHGRPTLEYTQATQEFVTLEGVNTTFVGPPRSYCGCGADDT